MAEDLDYLTNLPDELKLSIFSYLDTFDIVQLEDVSLNLQHITNDRKLISIIRLYKEYRCTTKYLFKIVLHKLRHEMITSLNINCVYWISTTALRRCLKPLKLQCLYAVDTKLGMDDLIDLDLSSLHTLAITFSGTSFFKYAELNIFPKLKFLCIHYDTDPSYIIIVSSIIKRCTTIDEVWFVDLSGDVTLSITFLSIIGVIPRSVNKVTFSFLGSFKPIMLRNIGFVDPKFKTVKTKMHLCLDKSDNMDTVDLYDDSFYQVEPWKEYIVRLKCDFPFGLNDARKLIFKKTTLEDMLWEELNLSHVSGVCSKRFRDVVDAILTSPNVSQLKRLSINVCCCQCKFNEEKKPGAIEPLFKKPRKAFLAESAQNTTFQNVTLNSPLLEELEIWECENVMKGLPKLASDALSSICDLQHLRKLTISGVPNYVTSKYLIDIIQNCSNLTSLRITSTQQSASLNNYLCISLPFAKSLRDFRFEQSNMPVCRLLKSFCEIYPPELQRLVLVCSNMSSLEVDSLHLFVRHNPQLKFMCLCITGVPKSMLQHISRELKNLKKPDQIFLVVDSMSELFYLNIPYIHKVEMTDCITAVPYLDIFNGFATQSVQM